MLAGSVVFASAGKRRASRARSCAACMFDSSERGLATTLALPTPPSAVLLLDAATREPPLVGVTDTPLVGITDTPLVGITDTLLVGVTDNTPLVGITDTPLAGVTDTLPAISAADLLLLLLTLRW